MKSRHPVTHPLDPLSRAGMREPSVVFFCSRCDCNEVGSVTKVTHTVLLSHALRNTLGVQTAESVANGPYGRFRRWCRCCPLFRWMSYCRWMSLLQMDVPTADGCPYCRWMSWCRVLSWLGVSDRVDPVVRCLVSQRFRCCLSVVRPE